MCKKLFIFKLLEEYNMQKYDVSKFIMANFLTELPDEEKPVANRILINGIVDGWNNNIYFQPRESLKIHHYIPQNYHLM